ncbi:MAG: methylated-DNA--[protein]-cysteine S-methyltransferase [Chitinophagales bacterium]|nr:methylated-DNA--[protein]-cysteine S-methyltransferase [Chitinophagales bacterium]
MYNSYYESPIGLIYIESSDIGITQIKFVKAYKEIFDENELTQQAIQELNEYFNRKRKIFSLPLDLIGTVFQKTIWQQLLTINYGKTQSYEQVALSINNIKAIRAVGSANGNNPIAIVVPCHRVIGKNGTLVGYAGELWRKKWLLDFEQNNIQTSLFD